MGIRGELFSTRFACDGRTYFFNVKQNRNGDVFLSVVESKPSEGESFDRRSIVVFAEHMAEFLNSFQAALKFIDKTGFKVAPDPAAYSGHSNDDEGERPRRGAESRPRRDAEGTREGGHGSSFRERDGSERKPARRAIVRTGPPSSRSKDPSARSGASYGRPSSPSGRPSAPAGRSPERTGRTLTDKAPAAGRAPAGKTPAGSPRGADKPVKRIVVRKTRKPDAQD